MRFHTETEDDILTNRHMRILLMINVCTYIDLQSSSWCGLYVGTPWYTLVWLSLTNSIYVLTWPTWPMVMLPNFDACLCTYTGWWFGTCFFHFIYGIILAKLTFIFFKMVKTTNQMIHDSQRWAWCSKGQLLTPWTPRLTNSHAALSVEMIVGYESR